MASLTEFDVDPVRDEALRDFSAPIPAGEYLAQIVESEMKDTKDGGGKYLYLVWEVLKGDCKGRKLFDRLNLRNTNEAAVRIAKATLVSIERAMGFKEKPKDSQQLHGKTVLLKVTVEKRKDTGELENRIRAYSPKPTGALPPASMPDEPVKPLPKDESDPF